MEDGRLSMISRPSAMRLGGRRWCFDDIASSIRRPHPHRRDRPMTELPCGARTRTASDQSLYSYTIAKIPIRRVPGERANMITSISKEPIQRHTQIPSPRAHSLALSPTVPILSLSPYLLSTFSLWYFQKDLVAFLPAKRLRILAPPGCSSRNSGGRGQQREKTKKGKQVHALETS